MPDPKKTPTAIGVKLEKTPKAIGVELAETLCSFHAEIIRQGLKPEFADSLAEKVASADFSIDGHCGDMPRASRTSQPG